MQTYIRETESVFVILPRCAAAEDDSNPGYQKYMAFLLNPAAARRAQLLRQLSDKGCTHRRGEHVRLRGNDVDGVSHSRKAEEYSTLQLSLGRSWRCITTRNHPPRRWLIKLS